MKKNLYREDFKILSLVIIGSFYYLFTYINSPINYAALILFLISILILFASLFILLRIDVRYSLYIQIICFIIFCLVIITISSLTIVKEIELRSYIDNVSKIVENNELDYTYYNLETSYMTARINSLPIDKEKIGLYKLPYIIKIKNGKVELNI